MIRKRIIGRLTAGLTGLCLAGMMSASAWANDGFFLFFPGNLMVSRSVYDNNSNNVTVGQTLPPNCTLAPNCVPATNNGSYPEVFNNDLVDGSFGITSKIFLDQITPSGFGLGSLEVPNNAQFKLPFDHDDNRDQLVTSFSSKSEMALNFSTDRTIRLFMGYVVSINALDVSNANTPGVMDPTNPVRRELLSRRREGQSDRPIRFHGNQRLQWQQWTRSDLQR